MPESPEVHAFAEALGDRLVGARLRSVEIADARTLKTRKPAPSALEGLRVNAVLRVGKYVDVDAGAWHLVISFGRHGWAAWAGSEAEADPPAADGAERRGDAWSAEPPPGPRVVARVRSEGGGFDLTDSGGFSSVGLWVVAESLDLPALAGLGPDPAGPTFTRGDVERAVSGRRKQLKALLQDQHEFAGIGNAYSDEILFAARLSPVMPAASLTSDDRVRLFDAMRETLMGAIAARRGIPIPHLKAAKTAAMRVHGRGGEPCERCGGVVHDVMFAGASAQYCPACQTGGVVL